jgi:hypothetical protein
MTERRNCVELGKGERKEEKRGRRRRERREERGEREEAGRKERGTMLAVVAKVISSLVSPKEETKYPGGVFLLFLARLISLSGIMN